EQSHPLLLSSWKQYSIADTRLNLNTDAKLGISEDGGKEVVEEQL
ncbi:hypothetical protein Tco_0503671, partial [Tanacetum coccineum]